MINFKQLEDGAVIALMDQQDGSTRVIAEAKRSGPQKPDPVTFQAWEIIDDKLNSVGKIAVAQSLSVAYAALNHAAVIRDLLRTKIEALKTQD